MGSSKERPAVDPCSYEVLSLCLYTGSDITLDAPARLKQELDKVLQLQSDAEALDGSIGDVKKALRAASSPAASLRLLADLQKTQDSMKSQAEALYASLNIAENFPTLTGANLKFVQHMYLARDLKINIRNRAVESFEEWARLDSVVHGHEPIGRFISHSALEAVGQLTNIYQEQRNTK